MAALVAGAIAVLFIWGASPGNGMMRWTKIEPPPGLLNMRSLTATPSGFAVLSSPGRRGVILWSSPDGSSWEATTLSGAPARMVLAGTGLITVNGHASAFLEHTDEGWEAVTRFDHPEAIRIGYGSGRAGLVAGSDGFLAQTVTGDVYWSVDGSSYELVVAEPQWGVETGMPTRGACDPPEAGSLDIPPLVSTPTGFIALVSRDAIDPFGAWPVCEPQVWSSTNGRLWEWGEPRSPFGQGAYVYDLAWRQGRFVAVGGVAFDEPAVWVSDDGRNWLRIAPISADEPYELRTVQAGGLGWVLLGEAVDGPRLFGWVSGDGLCWEPIPGHVRAREAAVGSDRILLADRSSTSTMWLGTVDGALACRLPA